MQKVRDSIPPRGDWLPCQLRHPSLRAALAARLHPGRQKRPDEHGRIPRWSSRSLWSACGMSSTPPDDRALPPLAGIQFPVCSRHQFTVRNMFLHAFRPTSPSFERGPFQRLSNRSQRHPEHFDDSRDTAAPPRGGRGSAGPVPAEPEPPTAVSDGVDCWPPVVPGLIAVSGSRKLLIPDAAYFAVYLKSLQPQIVRYPENPRLNIRPRLVVAQVQEQGQKTLPAPPPLNPAPRGRRNSDSGTSGSRSWSKSCRDLRLQRRGSFLRALRRKRDSGICGVRVHTSLWYFPLLRSVHQKRLNRI